MSLFEIKCPSCKATLWIDPSTCKVVDHKSADHQKADFGEFLKSRQGREGIWDEKMKKAREEEAKRKADLEQKFKMAKENPDQLQGDGKPDIMWD
jgi:benzoyl-CoA reductase/2-hydroxyglutaryl-CoA dehydratase subunit BcrC/BadD/HgdB